MKTLVRTAAAMLLAFGLSASTTGQQPFTPRSGFLPRAQDQDRDDRGGREQHPHIRGAIRELREAKKELQTAAHDFGGHRADALRSVDEAIHQLQLALQYDKK
jgi:hypothetical protein